MASLEEARRIHFVGIGGCSMSGIARILNQQGHIVAGSDREPTQFTGNLEKEGITVYFGHKGEQAAGADLLVYSAAIKPENVERVYAREHGIPEMERSVALGQLSARFDNVVAVAGCHGKTTITSMLAFLNDRANLGATVHVGGYVELLDGGVHLGDDVAGLVIILGHDLGGGAVGSGSFDLHLALGGHVGSVHGGSQLLAGFGGEFTLAVQQLFNEVNAHQGHTLDVVHAVEVGAEVDGAGVSAAGDGQQNDGVRFQIGLEVRHLIQIVRKVHDQAVFARFAQLRRRTAQHVNVVHLLFPVIEFGRSAVALINAVELDSQRILDRNPGGLQVARVVGHAVGQRDAFARDFRVKGQAGFGIVVAGAHAKFGAFRIGQRVFRAGQADHGKNHDQCQYHREKLFHLGIPSFYF